jgi:DNA-binding NtrC family response regulator
VPVHHPSDPPRVLVVEDEPRLRDLLSDVLPDMGFACSAARTAEEAINIMAADPREIAIVDLNLPGMEGMEFFGLVRQRWPRTQVIILTGFGDLESARQAIHLNVVDFLTKPCHLGDLEVALARACQRWRGEQVLSPEAEPAAPPPPGDAESASLADLERRHILAVLARHGGNRTTTAAELGISRRTLHYRLTEYASQGYPVD